MKISIYGSDTRPSLSARLAYVLRTTLRTTSKYPTVTHLRSLRGAYTRAAARRARCGARQHMDQCYAAHEHACACLRNIILWYLLAAPQRRLPAWAAPRSAVLSGPSPCVACWPVTMPGVQRCHCRSVTLLRPSAPQSVGPQGFLRFSAAQHASD